MAISLEEEVKKLKWWHRIDLGNGIITPGHQNSNRKLAAIQLPEDLVDLSVLDIGAWDGFYSFEAEKRGAKRVLATDFSVWQGWGWSSGKEGFNLAKKVLNSKVEEKLLSVYDLSSTKEGSFDITLFLGVFYHLKYPLLALEKISEVTNDLLILETHLDPTIVPLTQPLMRFYPKGYDSDLTNWWGPNTEAVKTMLEVAGFKTIKTFPIWASGKTSIRQVFHGRK